MLNIQVSDTAANMPRQAKTVQTVVAPNYSNLYFYSPDTLPTHAPDHSEIEDLMYQATKDAFCDSDLAAWRDEIKDTFEYHLNKVATMFKYIISEVNKDDEQQNRVRFSAKYANAHLEKDIRKEVLFICNNLNEDSAERLFVEFCERPDFL